MDHNQLKINNQFIQNKKNKKRKISKKKHRWKTGEEKGVTLVWSEQ